MKKKILSNLLLMWIYGSSYVTIEVFYRGYSHWSMFLIASIIGFLVGSINEIYKNMSIIKQALIGSVIATILEGITGLIVNVWLHLGIWDYSNLWGSFFFNQCNIFFVMIWFLLCILCIFLDDCLRNRLNI